MYVMIYNSVSIPVYCVLQSVGGENVPWRVSEVNREYSMCETYPPIMGVPAAVSDEGLVLASQFRSKGRMPVRCAAVTVSFSWKHVHLYVFLYVLNM